MNDEEMRYYSRALDEIHRLRGLLAYEAGVLDATLDYKSFPKSRRPISREQVIRMRQAAQGESKAVQESLSSRSMWHVRSDLGIETLTRSKFEQEIAERADDRTAT